MGSQRKSVWLGLAALFLFAASTFRIVDGDWVLGVVFFAAAATFASVARSQQKKEPGAGSPEA